MERKPLELESTDNHQNPSSAVYGGSVTAVDSVEEDVQNQKKVVYRGWKVMPFIIGNTNLIICFSFLCPRSCFFCWFHEVWEYPEKLFKK
jgi:hypothetical protein